MPMEAIRKVRAKMETPMTPNFREMAPCRLGWCSGATRTGTKIRSSYPLPLANPKRVR